MGRCCLSCLSLEGLKNPCQQKVTAKLNLPRIAIVLVRHAYSCQEYVFAIGARTGSYNPALLTPGYRTRFIGRRLFH